MTNDGISGFSTPLKFYFPWISEILLECSVKKKKKSGQISFHYLKKKKKGRSLRLFLQIMLRFVDLKH